jgi:predicted TIM-barrel fold metal-dependent hydrolase
MIVDAHCHAGSGDGYTGPWDTSAPLGPYLRRARRAGIARTIVFPVFNSDYRSANRRLARIVERAPDRLIGFGMVDPRAEDVDGLVAEAVSLGLRGLKVHGHDALPGDDVIRAAARHRLPMLVDVVRRVEHAERMAAAYPDQPIIIPHLGAFADDWHAQQRLIGALRTYPRLYGDTSGVRYWDVLARAARLAPDKLIFGSDGPFLHPGVELEKIRLLGLDPGTRSAVCGGTILGLIGR